MNAGEQALVAQSPVRGFPWLFALGGLLALTLAEATVRLINPVTGLGLFAFVLLFLLVEGSVANDVRTRRFFLALSLPPVFRMVGLSLPAVEADQVGWSFGICLALLLATATAMRVTGFRGNRIGLAFRLWPVQVSIGLTCAALGVIGSHVLLKGQLPLHGVGFQAVSFAGAALQFAAGIVQEIAYRGLIQSASIERLGRFGIVYVAVTYAVMETPHMSLGVAALTFLVGLGFGAIALRTRSVLGVSIAHGLISAGMYFGILLPI